MVDGKLENDWTQSGYMDTGSWSQMVQVTPLTATDCGPRSTEESSTMIAN